MSIEIDRAVIEALDFDLDVAISAHAAALKKHSKTIGVAAPVAPAIVDAVMRAGGYSVIEPPPVEEVTKTAVLVASIFRRCTNAEAVSIENELNKNPRLKRILGSLQVLSAADADYAGFIALLDRAIGPDRTVVVSEFEF